VEGNGRGPVLRYYPSICLEELRKTTKTLSPDSLSPERDLNPGPPEHEAGVLTTRRRRLVVPFEDEACLLFKNSVRTSKRTQLRTITKIN
jgi:hypothetical protein